jgi:tRNA(fMet)-specific endonuclease VapC
MGLMRYLLDTNICSYIIKYRPIEVWNKFKTLAIDDCVISSITVAELRYWVAKNKRLHYQSQNHGAPKINEQVIDNFISHLFIADFDDQAAKVYGHTRDILEAKGISVSSADLFIGSHAISLGLILVTNNLKDFTPFPTIQLENWIATV